MFTRLNGHRIAVEESRRESLPTAADPPPSVLTRPQVRDLFDRVGVLNPLELESRFEVYGEQYVLPTEVEAKVLLRVTRTQIYPAVMEYLDALAQFLCDQGYLSLPPDRSSAGRVTQLNRICWRNALLLSRRLMQLSRMEWRLRCTTAPM